MTIQKFQKEILDWYKENRRDMPWRNTKDPYKILVSEIMLQQTQIPRVLPKYKEFLQEFPTTAALAKASDKKLLKVWAGLGYWRRAKYLKETAKLTKTKFPREIEQLEKLPGIGPYTARAVSCFAFNKCEPFLDTNIRRVYLHFFFKNKMKVRDAEILKVANKVPNQTREWHYALFDYGATVLRDKSINKRSRHYAKQSKFEGSFRSYRTKVVKFLLAQPKNKATQKQIEQILIESPYPTKEIIDSLLKDNLIKKKGSLHFEL